MPHGDYPPPRGRKFFFDDYGPGPRAHKPGSEEEARAIAWAEEEVNLQHRQAAAYRRIVEATRAAWTQWARHRLRIHPLELECLLLPEDRKRPQEAEREMSDGMDRQVLLPEDRERGEETPEAKLGKGLKEHFDSLPKGENDWLRLEPDPAQVVDFGENYNAQIVRDRYAEACDNEEFKKAEALLNEVFDGNRFPHTCPACGAPAYVGATKVECSKGCQE